MIPPHLNKRVCKAPNEILSFNDPRIKWPKLGSIKYDGHRMLAINGVWFVTPSGKLHVNRFIDQHFDLFWQFCRQGLWVADGELWSPIRPFNELQSILRTHNQPLPDDVGYYIFDLIKIPEWESGDMKDYQTRFYWMLDLLRPGFPRVHTVDQVLLRSPEAATLYYNEAIEAGHEGVILRSPMATYKHGRCTILESDLLKFKQFVTEDAVIVGIEQMETLREGVEREVNDYGLLRQTYKKEHYEPAEAVGSFVVAQGDGPLFKVKPGKGHTMEDRRMWWQARDSLIGCGIEFSYMPHGTKDAPRIGSLVRFREDKRIELCKQQPVITAEEK